MVAEIPVTLRLPLLAVKPSNSPAMEHAQNAAAPPPATKNPWPESPPHPAPSDLAHPIHQAASGPSTCPAPYPISARALSRAIPLHRADWRSPRCRCGPRNYYYRPHTPHHLVLLARLHPSGYPPRLASTPLGASSSPPVLRPAAARIQPPRVAFSVASLFLPEVRARLPFPLFILPARRQRRPLCRSRCGVCQIRALHADLRHRR